MSSAVSPDRIRDAVAQATTMQAPVGAWSAIEKRIGARETVLLPAAPDLPSEQVPAMRSVRLPRRGLAAAMIVLTAGGAAAAIAGVGAIRNMQHSIDRTSAGDQTSAPAKPVAPVPTPTELALDGNTNLNVDIASSAHGVTLRVRVGAERDAIVRATGYAAAANFRIAPGSLKIENAGPGEITLVLPATSHVTRVTIDGRLWIEKRGRDLRILGPAVDTTGLDFVVAVPTRSINRP
jgi:ferric-dicitrate binding protein FerR (iron transport regulator)